MCIRDSLRTALELLDQHGELAQTDVEADPVAELCGAYRHIGAGGTVARPTRIGPAMLFNTVKGHPGARVAIGVLSSRKRTALLLGTEPERLGWLLMDALQHLIQPTVIKEMCIRDRNAVHAWKAAPDTSSK